MFGLFTAWASAMHSSAVAEQAVDTIREEWMRNLQESMVLAKGQRIEQPELAQRREDLQRHRAAIRDAEDVEFKEVE